MVQCYKKIISGPRLTAVKGLTLQLHWTLNKTLYLGARFQPALYPNERSNEMHYEVPFVVIIQVKK